MITTGLGPRLPLAERRVINDEDTLRALSSVLDREMGQALGGGDDVLSERRQEALRYYEGERFQTDPTADSGRSQVVSRMVMETVEWVLPALLRIFTASDKIATIEPVKEEDEQAAEQATAYVSHIFFRDNPGFMILADWFKDGLIQKVGWVKRWWDTSRVQEVQNFTGLTRPQYDALLADPDVEIVEESSYQVDGYEFNYDRAVPAPIELYDCTLRVTRENGRIVIENVPPEEVLFSRRAKRGDIGFVCHRREWTMSDLLEQGYDEENLRSLPTGNEGDFSGERMSRYGEYLPPDDNRPDWPMRSVWVEESYVRFDADGDGIAELLKVKSVARGKAILEKGGKPDIEPVDEVPLVAICPVPMPHQLVGHSLADLVMDLQFQKSTIMRQIFDNIYLSNNPRTIVGEAAVTDETFDDLLMSRPGGIVRVRDASQIVPLITPFVAEKAFTLIEYLDQTGEVRTGVSRRNQGLNPDDLNKTATGVNLMQQAANQRVELIARVYAEGVRELVTGILGLVRRHQQQERIIKLTGQWLPMNPAEWKNNMQVTVSVGLGTGNRDQVLMHLMRILQIQQQIVQMQGGTSGPLVFPNNVYDTLESLVENAGFKQSFFSDPAKGPPPGHQPPPPKPDPEVMKAQAQMQAQAMKAQADAQTQQMKAQVQMALQQQQSEHAMVLERTKAAHDMQVSAIKAQMEAENEAREIALRAAAGTYTVGDTRPRGNGQG